METSQLRVAYLNSHYPAISHTFIAREVAALRDQGVAVSTFSIRPCATEDLVSESMRQEFARTQVIVGAGVFAWARAHASLVLRRSDIWLRGLARALRSGPRHPRARLWQLFYFGEAVVLFGYMRRAGLRHVHVHHANVGADVARLVCYMGNRDDDQPWTWTFSLHGPAEFTKVEEWDLAAKVESASAVACISDYCRAQVMALVPSTQWHKLEVIRMSADPNIFRRGSGQSSADQAVQLLTVGRLVPQKGFGVLLEAMRLLQDREAGVQLRVVGKGPEESALKALSKDLGIESLVTFVGALSESEVADEMRRADVFVSPSFAEGLPVVLMEAMLSGLPVVGTQVGAIGELVAHEQTGLIVPPSRADALADAITRLLQDPAERHAMGDLGAAKVAEAYVPARTGPSIHGFLRRAMSC